MWSSIGGFAFGASQLLFAYIVWQAARGGVKATDRVWGENARGLEWTLPSPAPHHTFSTPPVIREGDLAHGDITH
jgi:cytochrome c oxidase subunit I